MSDVKTAGEITGQKSLGRREKVCEKHGPFTSEGISLFGTELWSICPQCRAEKEKEVQAIEAQKAAELEKQRLAFIPERYRQETFDTYECETEKQRRAVQCLREYRGNKNIIIHGPPGTGKTHLMWALIKTNQEARYRKLSDIIRQVKCSFAPTARESEEDILNDLAKVKILVIDEIGRQMGSSFEMNFIFDLIDVRYSNYRPIILCSNLPLAGEESITSYIGSAAMDRINENAVEIYCDWDNYRKK